MQPTPQRSTAGRRCTSAFAIGADVPVAHSKWLAPPIRPQATVRTCRNKLLVPLANLANDHEAGSIMPFLLRCIGAIDFHAPEQLPATLWASVVDSHKYRYSVQQPRLWFGT